jgi:hypothetical protein
MPITRQGKGLFMPANSPIENYQPSRCNFIYLCQIAADGSFTFGPTGWTAEKTGSSQYRITHGLGHKRYSVLSLGPSGAYTATATLLDSDEQGITVGTQDSGVQSDLAFQAVLFATQ